MADARFTIAGSPSSNRGYDAAELEELLLALETPTPDIYKAEFSIWKPSDPRSPLASKNAPELVLDPTDGIPSPPSAAVLVTMPTGVHSYLIRCVVNDGVEAATGVRVPEWTFERIVSIRSASGMRKIVPGESTQYSARGWADAQNDEVDAAAAAGGDGSLYFGITFVNVAVYVVDSGPRRDAVLHVNTTAHNTEIRLPPHSEGRIIAIKDAKAQASVHPITIKRDGDAGKINSIPANYVMGFSQISMILQSDGVDNWLNLADAGQ